MARLLVAGATRPLYRDGRATRLYTFHDSFEFDLTCGTVQIGLLLSRLGYGPESAGQRAPGTTCTSKISSTPVTNSRCPISRPVVRSTTPTPHFSSDRRSAIGIPPKVDVSRIFERPTNAKRS